MHPDRAFRPGDAGWPQAFAAARAFAHIFACTADGPAVAHAPVQVTADGHLRFHLARRNPVFAQIDGAQAIASFTDADAYISPDWYGTSDQVPTWNYRAAEAHGSIRCLPDEATPIQLDALSAAHEARLAPKPVWTRAKMGPGRFEAMLGAIGTFELVVSEWRGTAKLSQNKSRRPARRRRHRVACARPRRNGPSGRGGRSPMSVRSAWAPALVILAAVVGWLWWELWNLQERGVAARDRALTRRTVYRSTLVPGLL